MEFRPISPYVLPDREAALSMMENVPRLSPEMASRKLQVLAFVRAYYRAHSAGPSLSEIANGLGTNKTRVQAALRKLQREGRIHREAGIARGIRPNDSHEEALRLLRADGWTVNPTRMEIAYPLPLIDIDEDGKLTVTK